jgi:hypothetical protein
MMMKNNTTMRTIIDSVIGRVSNLGYGGSIPPHPLEPQMMVVFTVPVLLVDLI